MAKAKEAEPKQLPGAFALFKPSWEAFKLNWPLFILAVLIPLLLVAFIMGTVFVAVPTLQHKVNPDVAATTHNSLGTAGALVSATLGSLLTVCALIVVVSMYYLVKLGSAKGKKQKLWPTFKRSLHYFWRLLGLEIVRFIIILAGVILLIVPGLFMWRRYMLAPYYLVDKDLSIKEAMRRSATDSKMFAASLWPMMGVYVLFALLGSLPMVGYAFSIFFWLTYTCAAAVRYLQIQAAK